MRSTIIIITLALVVAACSGEQELAPRPETSRPASTTSTSVTVPATTSTTVPLTTTTTPTTTTTTLPALEGLVYEEVARLDFPIHMVPWRTFDLIATKDGRVWLFEEGRVSETPVLDISDHVRDEGERGLLGIAVDPELTDRLFVHYSAHDGDTVVSEFGWGPEEWVGERVVLRLDQPAGNHNGGMLQFGPDGRLYLGLGDGGRSNDAFGNGQNRETLLGGIVAIDIDTDEAILYQYGLRNPWRFWFDDELVYVADVGQGSFEEVSVAPITPDVNYGWPITEGLHCFSPSSGCDTNGLTLPVIEVSHGDAGTCSITGGVVYRGRAIPELQGHYFYSDYCGGYLRSFRFEEGEAVDTNDWTEQVGVAGRVASFGTDGEGEMYVLTTDRVLQVVPDRAG
ncbi:MAG: PQQ-dependent sugar dehydrogenase [Acidimicrobiia bacterium]